MSESQRLSTELRSLQEKRKSGEISIRDFYYGLLELLANLKDALINENINEKQIKKQIPLLLAFIENQIIAMKNRE